MGTEEEEDDESDDTRTGYGQHSDRERRGQAQALTSMEGAD
jgi:hypothetical protein